MWVFHCQLNFRGDKHSIWCHLSGDILRGSYLKEWKHTFFAGRFAPWKDPEICFFFQLLYIQTVLLHSLYVYGGFLKWWYPTTMGFPTKTYHFGVFRGYHHLRKHPYIYIYTYLYLRSCIRPSFEAQTFLAWNFQPFSVDSVDHLFKLRVFFSTENRCKSFLILTGVIKWDPFCGGSNNYANVWWFCGILSITVHRLGWSYNDQLFYGCVSSGAWVLISLLLKTYIKLPFKGNFWVIASFCFSTWIDRRWLGLWICGCFIFRSLWQSSKNFWWNEQSFFLSCASNYSFFVVGVSW